MYQLDVTRQALPACERQVEVVVCAAKASQQAAWKSLWDRLLAKDAADLRKGDTPGRGAQRAESNG